MRHRKIPIPALSIFCLALLVRVSYNLTVASGYTPVFDAAIYNNLARMVVEVHCYCVVPTHPANFRPPLWPLIIAVIYFFGGEHSSYARLFYCFLGSGTCLFIYFLARDLFGQRIALITGLLGALYPGLFIWDGWLYSESLFTFCLTGYVFALSRLQQNIPPVSVKTGRKCLSSYLRQKRWIVWSGLAIGLAMLTRPTGSLLLGVLGVWAVLTISGKMLPWQTVVKNTLSIILLAIIVNSPWLYRNYMLTHNLLPVSTIGTTLVGNYNDAVFLGIHVTRGMWLPPDDAINPDFTTYTMDDERIDTERAFAWMRTHMSEMPELRGLHVLNMLIPYSYAHGLPFEEFPERLSSRIVVNLIPATSFFIFALAALGLFVTWKQHKKQLLLVYLVIGITILQNMAFYGSPRYRAPIEPLLVLLAGGGLWWLLSDEPGTRRYLRARKRGNPAGARPAPAGITNTRQKVGV